MRLRRGIRLALAAGLALAVPLAGSTTAQAKAKETRQLTVMTQNLYLGSSLNPALEATTPEGFVGAVAQIYGTMETGDGVTRRSAGISDERATREGPGIP